MGKYDPPHCRSYKAQVQSIALEHMSEPLTGPIELNLTFFLPRPTIITWKTKPMPAILYDKRKNDIENLSKSIMDALTSVAYLDDGQIARALIEKWYCAGQGYGDTRPRVEVELIPLNYDGSKRKGGL